MTENNEADGARNDEYGMTCTDSVSVDVALSEIIVCAQLYGGPKKPYLIVNKSY